MGIIVLSPLLILCALITKFTSKGPILFRSQRIGRGGKNFTFYKFRSMRIDAPKKSPAEMSEGEHDSYITKWGKIMRKTSLDEIPQLFNILKGDMSFIGPRPGLNKENELAMYEYRMSYTPNAYLLRPGLSGYSQIVFHRDHSPEKKGRGDSYYVAHISMWLDIKLFIESFLVLFGYDAGK